MKTQLDRMLAAYIECALWAETDNVDDSGGEPLDARFSPEDIAPISLARMRADCEGFLATVRALPESFDEWDDEQLGHDFWLTRNGHGAGFWDRGWPGGDALSKIAQAYGSCDIYVGDDGRLHII